MFDVFSTIKELINDFITIFENAINFLKYEYDCILHVVVFVFT